MNRLDDDKRLAALSATGLTNEADEALDRFASMVRRIFGVPVGLVSLVDAERQFFPGAAGLAEPYGSSRQTPLSHSICQSVVVSGQPIIERDVREVPGLQDSLAVSDLSVVAYAGVPLTDADGLVLGSLCAIDGEPRSWSADDVANLHDLAAACSSELRLRAAARTAREAEELAERYADQVELTADAAEIISAAGDVTTALERLVALLVPRLADWGYVLLIDDDARLHQLAYRHRHGHAADMARYAEMLTTSMTEHSPTYRVLHGAPPQLISPLPREAVAKASTDEAMSEIAERLGAHSFIAVPLTARGQVLGAIGLVRSEQPFDVADLRVAVDLAVRAGAVLDNARLHEQQRRVAEVLQRSLLSDLPELTGLQLAAAYRPSAQGVNVGGDWYDAFRAADGAATVVIGDVMGHDIDAAAAMGQLRSMLRTIAFEHTSGPADILRRVDSALQGLDIYTMATAVVARIEPVSAGGRRVTWSNAGHPPPVLASAGGQAEVLHRPPDLMLGIDPCTPRRDHVIDLADDSTLVLFTDGLVEHRDLDIEDGLARLRTVLAATRSTHPGATCAALIAEVSLGTQEDDVAILAVSPRS